MAKMRHWEPGNLKYIEELKGMRGASNVGWKGLAKRGQNEIKAFGDASRAYCGFLKKVSWDRSRYDKLLGTISLESWMNTIPNKYST